MQLPPFAPLQPPLRSQHSIKGRLTVSGLCTSPTEIPRLLAVSAGSRTNKSLLGEIQSIQLLCQALCFQGSILATPGGNRNLLLLTGFFIWFPYQYHVFWEFPSAQVFLKSEGCGGELMKSTACSEAFTLVSRNLKSGAEAPTFLPLDQLNMSDPAARPIHPSH